MKPLLTSMFSKEEREAAGLLGQIVDKSLVEKVSELFEILPDPLLSGDDVAALLVEPTVAQVDSALQQLEDEGFLESSASTLRPFDPADVRLFRRSGVDFDRLILAALEAQLADGTSRYQLTVDGRLIRSIAEVDRLDAESATGQQRPEIKKHVEDIANGIKNGTAIPNSILLTLTDEKVQVFDELGADEEDIPESWSKIRPISEWISTSDPGDRADAIQRLRLVEIDFPYRRACFDSEKTALLVDGQQRTAAISLVDMDVVPRVDLSVNAIVAGKDEAKLVFGIANNSKPIPNDFKLSLLAAMNEPSGFLQDEQVRASATRILALGDHNSPFYHLVRYPGFKSVDPTPVVYNSLFHVVRAFEKTTLPGHDTAEGLAQLVSVCFNNIKDTWPNEWGRPPGKSKLMAGAGLRSMADLVSWWLQMEVGVAADEVTAENWAELAKLLDQLEKQVAWSPEGAAGATDTARDFFNIVVQEKQNTNQDINKLYQALQGIVAELAKGGKKSKRKSSPGK